MDHHCVWFQWTHVCQPMQDVSEDGARTVVARYQCCIIIVIIVIVIIIVIFVIIVVVAEIWGRGRGSRCRCCWCCEAPEVELLERSSVLLSARNRSEC